MYGGKAGEKIPLYRTGHRDHPAHYVASVANSKSNCSVTLPGSNKLLRFSGVSIPLILVNKGKN